MRPCHRYPLQIERLCRKSGVATSTDYRTWLSSDYLLNALAYDPATTTKRLGDGFYEQKLVREQVAQLTGRRFLTGYTNDETEYQALMNNGITIESMGSATVLK